MSFLSVYRVLKAVALMMVAAMYAAPAQAAQPFRDCPTCPEMVIVPSGRFQMGTPAAEAADEKVPPAAQTREGPVHEVTIARRFAMGLSEVTRDQFAAFVADTGWVGREGCFSRTSNGARANIETAHWRAPGIAQTGTHPVVCVAYDDAQAYAAWLSRRTGYSYRLPSEAEWEYAARAGTSGPWFWGADRTLACMYANVPDRRTVGSAAVTAATFDCDDGSADTAPAASYKPNAYGLYDMIGNVWEWTEDCWHATYERAPADGSAWRAEADCDVRVVRGGGWAASQTSPRSAARSSDPVTYRGIGLGFRVARDF